MRGRCVFEEDFCHGQGECRPDLLCVESRCVPGPCTSDQDCQDPMGCMICVEGSCQPRPPWCWSDLDCCGTAQFCYFGLCGDLVFVCLSGLECRQVNADFPRCLHGRCLPECLEHEDCVDGLQCVEHHCEAVPRQCEAHTDCPTPEVCVAYRCVPSDACGNTCLSNSEVCDPFTARCASRCEPDPVCGLSFPHTCCPYRPACDVSSGRCRCLEGGCPVDAACEVASGTCTLDPAACEPACGDNQECVARTCVQSGAGLDGAPCTRDSHCDGTQGYLCDNGMFCWGCLFEDESFSPGFSCRAQCDLRTDDCGDPAYRCRPRLDGPTGLCIPVDAP